MTLVERARADSSQGMAVEQEKTHASTEARRTKLKMVEPTMGPKATGNRKVSYRRGSPPRRKKGEPVTSEAIRSTVKALSGVSISANTIHRNEAAYEAYEKHRTEPRRKPSREACLFQLLRDAPTDQRTSLRTKINRLRLESKDALIVKFIRLENAAHGHDAREPNLREETLRLTLDAGTRRSK
jgi:hypothetical protein